MTQKSNFQNKDKLLCFECIYIVTLFTNAFLKRLWNSNDQTARNLLKFQKYVLCNVYNLAREFYPPLIQTVC